MNIVALIVAAAAILIAIAFVEHVNNDLPQDSDGYGMNASQ